MKAEFDIRLSVQDMYRFSMHHNYTGFQGIFSILIAIMAFVAAFLTHDKMGNSYTVLYILFGIVFLFYMPITLYLAAKRQILKSDQLKNTLHYLVDENGITVSQNGESATLPWKQVYKMVATKHNLLVYSTRVNAYILPLAQLGDQYKTVKEIAGKHLEKCAYCIRK